MGKLTQYVDMTFGTGNNSLCTIGPERPHGSVCPGPDTYPPSYSTGYLPTMPIRGFSHIHVNAGEPKYGNYLFSPQVGLSTALNSHDSEKANERADVAEYSVNLTRWNIDCAFTPTEHSVLYKFTYPKTDDASLVIDISHYHHLHRHFIEDVNLTVDTNDKGNTVFYGFGKFEGMKYELYYYAEVDRKATGYGTFIGSEIEEGESKIGPMGISDEMVETGAGAYLRFNTEENNEVLIRIGLSFHSIEKAKKWLYDEIPTWNYDALKAETVAIWEDVLGRIKIADSASDEQKRMFYTCFYICHKMPRDRTGDIHQYGDAVMIDDHIAIWDTFRSLYPLFTITEPSFVAKTVNSFITRFKLNGTIRDIFNGGKERRRNQGGDNTDNIIVEAYLKGIEGVDWDEAYKLVKDDADTWRDDQSSWFPVKGAPSTYRDMGWIPGDDPEKHIMCCSKQLEYCYNDYLAALMAKGLGHTEDYEEYMKRSGYWKNIWNPDREDAGFRGYIWPRAADGSWIKDDEYIPSAIFFCLSWKPYFYEGKAYEYSFFVPHDVETLIEKMGGENLFCERLHVGIDNNYINAGNQPGMLQPFLPNHTSKPWHTALLVEKQLKKYKPDGAPGCEDSGCFCSYYIFANIGIFPSAGQDFYYLTSPKYESTTFNLPSGKKFVIRAIDLSDENKFIQSVTLNGKPFKSTAIKHSDIVGGGELVFTMGSTPINYAE